MVLVLFLGACGGGDSGPDDPGPTAEEAVAEGIEALRLANTAMFTTRIEFADTTYADSGSYQLEPRGQQFTREAATASLGSYRIEAVGVGGAFYVKLPQSDDEPSDCWLAGDPQVLTNVTGAQVGEGAGELPGVVFVAAGAVGSDFVEDPPDDGSVYVSGSVDLAQAAALFSGRLPEQLGIASGDARVRADFRIAESVLSGLRIDAAALNEAVATTPDAVSDQGKPVFPVDTVITATFDLPGFSVDIEAPPPDLIVEILGDQGQAEQDLAACDEK